MLKSSYIPGLDKINKDLPAPNMSIFMGLAMEAMNAMMQLGQMEQDRFTDSELKDLAIDIVRQILEGTAEQKRGVRFEDFTFEIEFVRGTEDLSAGVQKLPKDDDESNLEEKLRNAIRKRTIINCLTQGFALTNQERMFDPDLDEIMAPIQSDMLQTYFRFMRAAVDSHKYLDIEFMKKMLKQMGEMQEENPAIVPARMEIEYRYGKPVIIVKAYCLILVIQEMVKGVFEIVSHHGLKYEKEMLREIYARTENWVEEQRGFVYGPIMVRIFRDYWKSLQDALITNGVITEYDDSMLPPFLAMLYDREFISDARFLDIMANIFNKDLDSKEWKFDESIGLYSMYIEFLNWKENIEDVRPSGDDLIVGDYGDEGEYGSMSSDDAQEDAQVEELNITMDELLDKISSEGMDSLSEQERELLLRFSSTQ